MKSPEETPRLLEEPGEIGRELKLGLERMSSNLPSAEQLASLSARLGVRPDGADVSSSAPASKTLLKMLAGAGISGAVLFALLRGSAPDAANVPALPVSAATPVASSDERPAPLPVPGAPVSNGRTTARPGVPPDSEPPAVAPDTAPLAPTTAPGEPAEVSPPSERKAAETPRPNEKHLPPSERAEPRATSRAPVATSESSPAPARAPSASAPSETALLRDARLALNGDPAGALALTEQHRREYPSGGFAQEREVIAITALARLGRTSEARSRAERFRSAYPTSPYIERVDRAVPP
jgi:hypothetical protein